MSDIYNTDLYNTVLEAIDKGKVVVFLSPDKKTYFISLQAHWYDARIQIDYYSDNFLIYPEGGATNLYQPINITISELN